MEGMNNDSNEERKLALLTLGYGNYQLLDIHIVDNNEHRNGPWQGMFTSITIVSPQSTQLFSI